MSRQLRDEFIEEVTWNTDWEGERRYAQGSVRTLECWHYEGVNESIPDANYQEQTFQAPVGPQIAAFEESLKDWLCKKVSPFVSRSTSHSGRDIVHM